MNIIVSREKLSVNYKYLKTMCSYASKCELILFELSYNLVKFVHILYTLRLFVATCGLFPYH